MDSSALIDDLVKRTKENLNEAERLAQLPMETLNNRPGPESWSILECFEHLNRYGDYYLPEIRTRIQNSTKPPEKTYKSGLLGGYFANSMLPKEKLNKMKTFESMNPLGSDLDLKTTDRFILQQKETLELLQMARSVSLKKIKVPISISKYIRLRLGDVFKVMIYHNQRHLVQAQKVLKEQRAAKEKQETL